MKNTFYEITITETGRNTLKDESSIFHKIKEPFPTKEAVKDFLKGRYGSMVKRMENPKETQKIFKNEGEEIGFVMNFWNRDISHDTKSWYQSDWIIIKKLHAENVLYKDII